MFLATIAFLYLPRHSSTAWFLTPEEKAWAKERMKRDSGGEDYAARGITWLDVKCVLTDWKIWVALPANIFSGIQGQAFTVFLPLIVQQLGYASYHANLYAVPIYVVGAVGLWSFAFSSDHFKERTIHILVALAIVILGLVLVGQLTAPRARYAALCILQIGNFATSPILVALLANNTPRPGHRALIIAVNGMGNISGVAGSELFRAKYAPRYQLPFYVSLGCAIYAWFNYLALRLILLHINKKRAKKVAEATPEEIEAENVSDERLGDKKWTFVYTT